MANKYWVGSVSGSTPASGNWSSSTGWRTTSGGLVITTPPGTADVAVFDNNSFLGAAITVTVSSAQSILGIDASGITTGANGVTLAGTGAIEIRNSGSITLPSSRFFWTNTGILSTRSGATCTWTTNGVSISSPISLVAPTLTLGSNINCTNTLTVGGGTINFGSYQIFCTTATVNDTAGTWNATTQGAGITVTNPSGTVLTWPARAGRPTFSAIKPAITFTSSDPSITTGRTVNWTGTSHYSTTSTTPGFVFTNGSDQVNFSLPVAAAGFYFNFAFLDTTGFNGSITFSSNTPTTLNIYGDITIPPGLKALSVAQIGLAGTSSNKFAVNATSLTSGYLFFVMSLTAVYVQQGNLANCSLSILNGYPYQFTTGYFIFNNTGIISANYNAVNNTYFTGDITFGTSNFTLIDAFNFTLCTSITKQSNTSNLSSDVLDIQLTSLSIPITLGGATSYVYFTNATQTSSTISFNGNIIYLKLYYSNLNNIVFNSYNVGFLDITYSTITNSSPITINTTGIRFNTSGNINLPNNSIINTTGGMRIGFVTVTNQYTVNFNISSGTDAYIYNYSSAGAPSGAVPTVNISGGGNVYFEDGNSDFTTNFFKSLNTTGFTGTFNNLANLCVVYLKDFLTQSSTDSFLPVVISLYDGASGGSFSLNTSKICRFYGSTSTQSITFGSSTLEILPNFSSTGYFQIGSASVSNVPNTITVSSGTTGGPCTLDFKSSTNLNNVVINSASVVIIAGRISNLTNSVQPTTVKFASNITFGAFGLNGTSGNLVTVGSNTATQRTLTKGTAWTLANSTDSGNNTGLTFGSTGNNAYLSVSYINGVVVETATGNMFLMF